MSKTFINSIHQKGLMRAIFFLIILLGGCLRTTAQTVEQQGLPEPELSEVHSEGSSHRPSFGLDYTGEVQTDFKRARFVNLLQLHADIPFTRKLSLQLGSISTLATDNEYIVYSLQDYSNINVVFPNIPFAFTVAGLTWQFNDRHSLFAGIRRTDEDYFCSDGLSLFTNSSYGILPTFTWNVYIGTFPEAALGLHYAYDHKNLRLQASLYNGFGNHEFKGEYNVFRFCPKSDGIFTLGQAEYRYRGSHYYLGASLHTKYADNLLSTLWTYAEQALTPDFTLMAIYSHVIGPDISCRNFCALGGKYSIKRFEFGLFSNYTNVVGFDEFSTEFLCSYQLWKYITVKPVLHVITTDGKTNCVGLFRMNFSINN